MNILKKFLIVLSSILVLSSLCGCIKKNESVDEIMKKSFEAQKNIKSVSCSMDMSLSFVSDDMPLDVNMSGTVDTISNQNISKADFIVNISNILNLNIIIYSKQEGSDYNVYTGIKIGNEFTWEKDTVSLPEISNFSSFANSNFVKDIVDYSLVGEEKINGKNTYHVIGTISKDGIIRIFDYFGVTLFDQLDEEEKETFDLILDLLDKFEVDIWVYTDNYLEAKLQIDTSDLLKSIYELSPETSEVIKNAIITITFDDYNNVDSIEIPQEALEASESSY